MERSSLSARSRKLFTLSAIHYANNALLSGNKVDDIESAILTSIQFWDELGKHIKEWHLVRDSRITSGEIRQDFVHCHSIMLHAIGLMGSKLLRLPKAEQNKRLKLLNKINWKRSNSETWEGRAMLGGRIQKASNNVTLSTIYLKQQLNLELTPEEQRTEDAFNRGENG